VKSTNYEAFYFGGSPKHSQYLAGLEVPTAVTMTNAEFWVVKPCSSERSRDSAGFLRDLLFCPEVGRDIFLRNVELYPNYTTLQHRNPYSFLPITANIKSADKVVLLQNSVSDVTGQAGIAIMLWARVREVIGSNLGRDAGYICPDFSSFSLVFHSFISGPTAPYWALAFSSES
jgi:hypothetical protein